MKTPTYREPTAKQQKLLETIRVRPLRGEETKRAQRRLEKQHYLGGIQAVGERHGYVAVTPNGGWMAVLLFCAACKHLKGRDAPIGGTVEQRRRRLRLVVNNARFLLLPEKGFANLGTRVMKLALERLSVDGQAQYGHPVLMVATLVDPQIHNGVVYRAGGWTELGATKGWGRGTREYYEKHGRPKPLFAREWAKPARRSLQAEHLQPSLVMVEEKVRPRGTLQGPVRCSLAEHFKGVTDHRQWIGL